MSKFNLPVPYAHAAEVIAVILNGLVVTDGVPDDVRRNLERFCGQAGRYLEELGQPPPSNAEPVGLGEVLTAIEAVERAGLTEEANLLRAVLGNG